MHNICHCGRLATTTSGSLWKVREYNDHNEVIYAQCIHGVVIIDKKWGTADPKPTPPPSPWDK